ncbi:MAG: 50S ribosomal protein L20 [Patescibacteria group bacterium]|nr:50S ribosomal protein L20 [Patescibacteria group bacterium]
MPRTKTGTVRRKRHKKILKETKGYKGTRSRLFKRAHEAYLRAGEHAFAGRKLRKRDMRKLWIQRINAALNEFNLPYSRFINLLKKKNIDLNRKMLAELAIRDPEAFKKIVETVTT